MYLNPYDRYISLYRYDINMSVLCVRANVTIYECYKLTWVCRKYANF